MLLLMMVVVVVKVLMVGGGGGFGGGSGGGGGSAPAGFGGGGGGAVYSSTPSAATGGLGGFGGGQGGAQTSTGDGGGGGGGGGLGGAVFVMNGATLTLENCAFSSNNAIGGSKTVKKGDPTNPAFFSGDDGLGLGKDAFLMSSGTLNISISNASDTLTLASDLVSDLGAGGGSTTAGGLSKSGAGTLVLSGSNTYTGKTTIQAGVLHVAADSALGDANTALELAGGTLQTGSTFVLGNTRVVSTTDPSSTIDTNGHDLSITSAIGGGGGIVKVGAGVLTLGGTNDLSLLDVKGGALAVSSSDNVGNAPVTLEGTELHATGTLTAQQVTSTSTGSTIGVDAGQTLSLAQGLTMSDPTMTLFKAGPGSLDIQAASTFAGTLNISDGTVSLSGNGDLTQSAYLYLDQPTSVFDLSLASGDRDIAGVEGTGIVNTGANHLRIYNDEDCSFAGQFTGSGGIGKHGENILFLTGDSAGFSGESHVREGHLHIAGNFPCPVIVYEGGSLGGTGSVGDTTNNGILMPGASIGTLTVASFTQGPGGSLEVELDDQGNSDLLNVLGAANLDGTLEIQPDVGVYRHGQQWTIIQAASVGGTFSNVVVSSPDDLTFQVFYLPTSVLLELLGGTYVVFPDEQLKGNAKIVSQYLAGCVENCGLAPTSDLYQVIETLTTLDVGAMNTALKTLSPAQFGALAIDNYASMRTVADTFPIAIRESSWCSPCSTKDKTCIASEETSVWLEPVAYFTRQRGAEGNFGYSTNAAGLVLGATHRCSEQVLLGGGLAYTTTFLDWRHDVGDSRLQAVYGVLTAGYLGKRSYITGLISGSGNFYNVTRKIDFATIHRKARNHHNGWGLAGRLETGLNFPLRHEVLLRPFLDIDAYNVFEQRYQEKGASGIDLHVKSKYSGEVRSKLALEVSKDIKTPHACWAPGLFIGWISEIPLTRNVYKAHMSDCSCEDMGVRSFHQWRNQAAIGFALLGNIRDHLELSFNYELDVGQNRYISQNAKASTAWHF